VAVASARPYANLHLAPDRQPCKHPTTQFLEARCPSCNPTNSVKALKAPVYNIAAAAAAATTSTTTIITATSTLQSFYGSSGFFPELPR